MSGVMGGGLATCAGILWLLAFPSYWRGEAGNPYIGILLFLVLPAVFVAGLGLIPVGIALHTRKRRKAGDTGPFFPRGGKRRNLGMFMAGTTLAHLARGSQFTYRTVTYTETDKYCGQTCHTTRN